MKTMMTATTSMVSRRRRRGIPPGRASGLAPRSMIIVFAPFRVIVFGSAKALALRLRNDWVRSKRGERRAQRGRACVCLYPWVPIGNAQGLAPMRLRHE